METGQIGINITTAKIGLGVAIGVVVYYMFVKNMLDKIIP